MYNFLIHVCKYEYEHLTIQAFFHTKKCNEEVQEKCRLLSATTVSQVITLGNPEIRIADMYVFPEPGIFMITD